jgi:hypothetical protein
MGESGISAVRPFDFARGFGKIRVAVSQNRRKTGHAHLSWCMHKRNQGRKGGLPRQWEIGGESYGSKWGVNAPENDYERMP